MAKQIEDTATRDMLPGDDEGITWWNNLSESDRLYWMDMAKSTCPADAWDQYRAARIGIPKPKRGRPATGQAMSAAERKRRQRQKAMTMVFNDLPNAPLTSILAELSHHVSDGNIKMVTTICEELIERTQRAQKRDGH